VVKYRGTSHGTNEYPFVIDERGISVLPVTSLGLAYHVSDERVSSGVARLDAMLGGRGYYRGSTVLVSGTSGVGKTSLAASFADTTCRRGERCLYLAFEESEGQVVRNMRSIGIDLQRSLNKRLLSFHASRPTTWGLELHLLKIHTLIEEFQPQSVVVDPVSSLLAAGTVRDTQAMLLRLIDFLKARGITALLTNLTAAGGPTEKTDIGLSSLVDTWLLLRDIELGGERNRGLYVLKSRGMPHSNQIREYVLSDQGIQLLDVYAGPEGVLTGSARLSLEARERAQAVAWKEEVGRKQRQLDRKRQALEAQIAALRAEAQAAEEEARLLTTQEAAREATTAQDQNRRRQRRNGQTTDGLARAGKTRPKGERT
jgi:circadian clock protein KaiC